MNLDSLPFDILLIVQRHLTAQENQRLILSSRYIPKQTPHLSFSTYKQSCTSSILHPQKLMHLCRESLDADSFIYLALVGHSDEFVRALTSPKGKQFPVHIKQQAFKACFRKAYYPATLWNMVDNDDPFHPIFTSQNEFRKRFENGYYPDIVMALLQDGTVDPSVDDCSCFISACYYGHLSAVQFLLRHPLVDPAVKSNTAFIDACSMGHFDIVQLLLQDNRVDPTDQDHQSICIAAENGHFEIVRLLLEDGRCQPQTLHEDENLESFNNCALARACEHGNVKIVTLLLESGLIQVSLNENLALRSAVEAGHYECVELLLRHPGLDLIEYPPFEDDIMTMAVSSGDIKTVEMLLFDDRIKLPPDAIRIALDEGYVDIVVLILSDPRTDPSLDDDYLLRESIERGYDDIVELLIQDERVDRSWLDDSPFRKETLLQRIQRVHGF